MEIKKQAVCGTIQSNDCFVRVAPSEELMLHLESTVMDAFGEQIEKVVKKTLEELGITRGQIFLEDKGALDYTIRARVETAVKRANG
jgi:citrate lyase subunit gamma (acyl carrier protein)